jgi:hypothetical protein
MQFDVNPTLRTHYRQAQYAAQQSAVLPTLHLPAAAPPSAAETTPPGKEQE